MHSYSIRRIDSMQYEASSTLSGLEIETSEQSAQRYSLTPRIWRKSPRDSEDLEAQTQKPWRIDRQEERSQGMRLRAALNADCCSGRCQEEEHS